MRDIIKIFSETLAFLVFNKLNSVKAPLATSWALTTPGRAASNKNVGIFANHLTF